MAAPCINETCSITAEINPIDRRLEMNVRIDPSGGLVCNDGLGLAANIFGDPAAAIPVDQCFQQLGVSPAGELWSIPQKAKTIVRAGNVVNIPQAAGSASRSANSFSGAQAIITNPFDCEAEILLFTQYRIGYTIDTASPAGDHGNPVILDASVSGGDGGNMIPYGAQIECRNDAAGAGGNFVDSVVFADIGGVVPGGAGVGMNESNRRHVTYGVTRRRIGANANLNLDAYANHRLTISGDVHWFNVTTVNPADAPTFPDRGFQASVLAIIFPFNSEDA